MKQYKNFSPGSLFHFSNQLIAKKKFIAAYELLLFSTKTYPHDDVLWMALVQACEKLQRFYDAHQVSLEWVAKNPSSFSARIQYFSRALNFCEWSRYKRDVDFFEYSTVGDGYFIGESTLTVPRWSLDLLTLWVGRYSAVLHNNNYKQDWHKGAGINMPQKNRIRVGFLGKDFYDQATNYLMIGFVEARDRDLFEYVAYDYGLGGQGVLRQRALSAYDKFHCVHSLSNQEIARLIWFDQIDVLLFVQGIADDRVPVLSYRPAQLQLAYLYYPGPFNLECVDGIIADNFVIPKELAGEYKCPVYWLDRCYQPNDDRRYVPDTLGESLYGIPEGLFVFANFNAHHKINPFILDVWSEILGRCERGVLWLLGSDPHVISNLYREFKRRGINKDKVYFRSTLPNSDHLKILAKCDLILDTYPYGGHTLTSDALWSGTPVLSLCGKNFSSRVAGSLLHSLGLNECVVYSSDAYIDRACDFYENPERLSTVSQYLIQGRDSFDIFNPEKYARSFERLIKDLIARS